MLVKVHNKNIHPYTEVFRGNTIRIEANSFIEMDEDEAEYFTQSFIFPKKDAQGVPDPLFFKKLKIEKEKRETVVDPLMCHANGAKAATAEELAKMIAGFSHMMTKDENAESEIKKLNSSLKKENKDLKTRLERIEAHLGVLAEGSDEGTQ